MDEIKFDGGYGREGVIAIRDGEDCDVCNATGKRVLWIDASEGEYAPGRICLTCAEFLIEKAKAS